MSMHHGNTPSPRTLHRRHVFAIHLAVAAAAWFASAPTQAQRPPPAPPDDPANCCPYPLTKSLDIRTGVAEPSGALLQVPSTDSTWTVTADPDVNTQEPRPSTAIPANTGWNTIPGTQWVNAYPVSGNGLNGIYRFETCFCLHPNFGKASFTVKLLADDRAEVFVNGTSIGTTPGTQGNFLTETTLTKGAAQLHAGRNCLTVDVENQFGVASGLDLAATLVTKTAAIYPRRCCAPPPSISGYKWNDLNGDGVQQQNEPPLAGWVIQLSTGQAAITDSLGHYSIVGLSAGTYGVSELQQPGWKQTAPAGGSYSVTLAAGQAVGGRDFGNQKCSRCREKSAVFIPAGPDSEALCSRLSCKRGEELFNDACGCGCTTAPVSGGEITTPDLRSPGAG